MLLSSISMYECIPAVANKYVELRDHINNSVLRICRWRTTWKCKKSPSYSGVVEALGDSKDIKSIISRTKREKKMPHMQGFIRISKSKSNNLIDILIAVLEFGGTINWTDDTDRHESCGNVDVRNEEQHTVTNEEQPSGQATKVGNTIHVQPMSEATRDDLPVVAPGQQSPHCERQHTHVEEEHSSHSERQHTHVEEQSTPYYEEQPLQDDVEGESYQVVQENPKRVLKCSHYLEPPYTDRFHYTKAHRGDHIQFDPLRNIDSGKQKRFDDALFGIRRRKHLYQDVIAQNAIILDENFPQLVTINLKSNLDMIHNELSRYISGESPHLRDIQTLELIVYDCSIGVTTSKELDDLMLPL
uniref:Uncharacterized protein n=1 Tax=Cannabis sativa TaxID=3483 RepID=A0A803Q337_CANSA